MNVGSGLNWMKIEALMGDQSRYNETEEVILLSHQEVVHHSAELLKCLFSAVIGVGKLLLHAVHVHDVTSGIRSNFQFLLRCGSIGGPNSNAELLQGGANFYRRSSKDLKEMFPAYVYPEFLVTLCIVFLSTMTQI